MGVIPAEAGIQWVGMRCNLNPRVKPENDIIKQSHARKSIIFEKGSIKRADETKVNAGERR